MQYSFHDKLVLRTPLNPIKTSYSVADLKNIFSSPKGNESLFLASPDLHKQFEKWISNDSLDVEKEKSLLISLHKYASRMHTRCTPFGLFASCGVLEWNESTSIAKDDNEFYRSTRLDMHFSCQLAKKIENLDFVKKHLLFYPNTSIYAVNNKVRFTEYFYKNKRRIHQISAIDNTDYVNLILNLSKKGALITELITELIKFDNEIKKEEAFGFIENLIEAQILVSELEPSVSGDELLSQTHKVLNTICEKSNENQLHDITNIITKTLVDLKKIDENLFNSPKEYFNLINHIDQLSIPYELNKLFQTDLFSKSKNNTLSNSHKISLQKTLKALNKLSSLGKSEDLKNFKEKFQERYEDAEISLVIALDNEVGVGYSSNNNSTGGFNPLVNDLIIPSKSINEIQFTWGKKDAFLFEKISQALKTNTKIISITEDDLSDFKEDWSNYPDTFSVMFSHTGNQLIFGGGSGSSAAGLLGRFASGSPEINSLVCDIANYEKDLNPDKIIAEIVHLPDNRVGNIILRPKIRAMEIAYLSKPIANENNKIDIDDLFISIKGDKIVLRSKKMNKEVLPRLSNAHNYSHNSLPIYNFLCDMQTQNKHQGIGLSLGTLFQEFQFLPRIVISDVIVSLAQWNLVKKDFEEILNITGDDLDKIESWKTKLGLPDLVSLSQGDNVLLVNLTDKLSLLTFIKTIKKSPSIVLNEFLHSSKNSVIKNAEGEGFSNEFIATLKKDKSNDSSHNLNEITPSKEAKRSFILGSEWLYYKVYCGVNSADLLLTDVIKPLADNLLNNKLIDSWFFIRYADPDNHLRIRFHLNDVSKLGDVISQFYNAVQSFHEKGLIHKIQPDTYNRELERYGDKTIGLSENYFYHDSANITEFLNLIDCDSPEGEKVRWLYALGAVDKLFDSFGATIEAKKNLCESSRQYFGEEVNLNKNLSKQFDKKFRANKNDIELILADKIDATHEYHILSVLLNNKALKTQPIIDEIKNISESEKLDVNLEDIVSSFIHMLINRLFKSRQRLHELVIYDFLWKIYRSKHARLKKQILSKQLKTI